MEESKFKLTNADLNAIKNGDSNYLNSKGAKLYREDNYKEAVEYYRVAAALGNIDAVSNLGYCYLYGRSIKQNLSLALAYFEIAAVKENVEACYKLGDIYESDKWGVKDLELSIYYYRMAASFLIQLDWDIPYIIQDTRELQKYPSLCFALGRQLMPGGVMPTDLDEAYQFLKQAEIGYDREITNGSHFYKKAHNAVIDCLTDDIFDGIREDYEDLDFDDVGFDDDMPFYD